MDKVRVLEINGGSFGYGGASVAVWKWYKHFNRNRVQVDFFCFNAPEDAYVREVLRNGGRIFVRKMAVGKVKRLLGGFVELRAIVKHGHYDCVQCNISNAYTMLLAFLFTKKYTNSFFIYSHNSSLGNPTPLRKALHYICRAFLVHPKLKYAACSDYAARWLFPGRIIRKKKYQIIHYGIETRKFRFDPATRTRVRGELGVDDRFVIGHVGRFAYQKNHEFLIDVFKCVHDRCPQAVLLSIGDRDPVEDLTDKIHDKVKRLGLEDSVIFYGNTNRIQELYQAMDCFVLPSRFEGLGLVALEAQAAGLKTLCADTIPPEAKVTGLLEYLPLTVLPEKWADRILSYNDGYERKDMYKTVCDAGSDIEVSAARIEEVCCARR